MGRKVRVGIIRKLFDNDGKFFIPGPGLRLIDDMPNVEWEMVPEFLPQVTADQIRGFDIVINLLSKVTRESLMGNSQLISVHCNSVGFDYVDVRALTDAGVILCNTPKAIRRPMATSIIAFILNLSLRLLDKQKLVREGRWDYRLSIGVGLVGKTLGSIGVGGIGHEMFRLAKPFGMKHIATTRTMNQEAVSDVDVQLVELETLLIESDFLNISCPLNKETYHLIGEKELRKMKKTAFLINIARGPVVNESALVKALQQGWIQGAAIDVFEQEPTPVDNPLLSMDNVIVTPHCVGSTDEAWMNKWQENVSQILKIIRGELPEGFVNREVWDKPEFQAKLKRLQEATR